MQRHKNEDNADPERRSHESVTDVKSDTVVDSTDIDTPKDNPDGEHREYADADAAEEAFEEAETLKKPCVIAAGKESFRGTAIGAKAMDDEKDDTESGSLDDDAKGARVEPAAAEGIVVRTIIDHDARCLLLYGEKL